MYMNTAAQNVGGIQRHGAVSRGNCL